MSVLQQHFGHPSFDILRSFTCSFIHSPVDSFFQTSTQSFWGSNDCVPGILLNAKNREMTKGLDLSLEALTNLQRWQARKSFLCSE